MMLMVRSSLFEISSAAHMIVFDHSINLSEKRKKIRLHSNFEISIFSTLSYKAYSRPFLIGTGEKVYSILQLL